MNARRLRIIGAGGHGKVVADCAIQNGYTDIAFVDDSLSGTCMGFPIVGTLSGWESWYDAMTDVVIAIGNNEIRERIAKAHPFHYVTLIHPSARIATGVSLGAGTVVMAGATINACAVVGEHAIINTHAVVEHDSLLEDYVHISPNAALGGTARVGIRTHIGIGATVSNNVLVTADCVIGAGAVVVKDVVSGGTYVGIPARKIK